VNKTKKLNGIYIFFGWRFATMHWWRSGMALAQFVLERPKANDHCGAMSLNPGLLFWGPVALLFSPQPGPG
jgi:rhamnose utilization protein RhaD (predicted bifunctional aldolase and dehydrogenase)